MITLLWSIAILQCFQLLLVDSNPISKRNSDEPDLSLVIAEEKLPRDIAPTGYILDIHPMPDDAYFKGRIIINLVWGEETNKIVLHADPDLVVYQPELVLIENNELTRTIKISRSEKDPEHSWYVIRLKRALSAGTEAQLSMSFTGKLNTDAQEGLFLSLYEDTSIGEDKYIIGSNFKPNFARKVFPCFDEPEYKAPFEISIVRKDSMSSLSNMPLVRTETILYDSSWSRDYFQESLPMSTFSLGILISELSSATVEEEFEGERNFDSSIQIWGPPDILEAAQNFTKYIFQAVNNMGEAFNLPYFLPKLDYVFVPGVEINSWGLIVQGETDIKRGVFYNVVLQWIGHLVTPGLWTDETITECLRLLIVSYIKPGVEEYQEEQDYLAISSMSYIDYTFLTNQDLPKSNDAFKIALLFRMLHYTLSETTLKQGVQRFISETKYKTFIETDLWNTLTDQGRVDGTLPSDLTVTDIADSWILSTRTPIITVKRNYRDNSATISQKPYQNPRLPNQESGGDYKWIVPVVVVKESKLDFTNLLPLTWLKGESSRLTKLEKRDQFIIVNPEQIGPFLVNYDERNWKLISEFLRKEEERESIPPVTRAKLLHDAFYLAYAGELNYKVALDLVPSLEYENRSLVWDPFLEASDYIGGYLSESSTIYEKYLRFMRIWLLSIYDRIYENSENSSLQDVLKKYLCKLGDKSCLEEAKSNFEKFVEAPEEEDCSMKVYTDSCYVFRWGGDENYELGYLFLGSYTAENGTNFSDHPLLKSIISCSAQSWKIEQMLNMSIFGHAEDFSDSDLENILLMLSENFIGYSTLLTYLNDNWYAIQERFEDNQDLMKKFIETAISSFKTKEGLELVKQFYVDKRDELNWAESAIEEAIKKVEEEVALSSVYYPAIEEWLDDYLGKHEDNTGDNFFLYER